MQSAEGICLKSDGKSDCCLGFHLVHGSCQKCPDGKFGADCKESCPEGRYGAQCAEECTCPPDVCKKYNGCPKTELMVSDVIVTETPSSSLSLSTLMSSPQQHSSSSQSSMSTPISTVSGTLIARSTKDLPVHSSLPHLIIPTQEVATSSDMKLVIGMGAGMGLLLIVILVLVAQRFLSKKSRRYGSTKHVECKPFGERNLSAVYQEINYDLIEETAIVKKSSKEYKQYHVIKEGSGTRPRYEGIQTCDLNSDLSSSTYLEPPDIQPSLEAHGEPLTGEKKNSYVEVIEQSIHSGNMFPVSEYKNENPLLNGEHDSTECENTTALYSDTVNVEAAIKTVTKKDPAYLDVINI
ncbi:uncharacterized protein LOC133173879 [Saccostrea echinata]|uniref:uncharacterized protein LOC133173879 n=1 Tax=Saccostrea echinata TaxID=191078 RepID=UPI002A80C85B|nr:uncharacterized protein LOC133173879 [Saccostrea echinata]